MKIVSFNVNGIRARFHQLAAVIDHHQPAVIALQETKVQNEEFPVEMVAELGYQAVWSGQKTHYGVALLSRQAPKGLQSGFAHDGPEAQRRFIAARYEIGNAQTLTVLNGYFPQGENRAHPVKFPGKERFYQDFREYLVQTESPGNLVLVVGDMNVAPSNLDIGIGHDNAQRWLRSGKCSFLPEEREWLKQLMEWGLEDTFRQICPARDDLFSWFDYRSRGFEREPRRGLRIDLILASMPLAKRCVDAGIDYAIRGMDRPSDHAPVWAQFQLT